MIGKEMRDRLTYYVEKVDTPLVWLIVQYAKRYPEPTHENVLYHNSHNLIDIRDKFLIHWDFKGRQPLFLAVFKLVIVKYEQSPQYRNVLDWVLSVITDWKPFKSHRQMMCWKGE